jgi:hypothetical protein
VSRCSSVLYVVRCRFTDPSREHAWNEWYAQHVHVLLRVPGFRAAQRLRSAAAADDRPYLAMYEVASPEVFTSEAYLAIWGFDQWRESIDNWTRDLFELLPGEALDFATPPTATLRAVFIGGEQSAAEAALGELAARAPSARVARISGLDRSCAGIAWQVDRDPVGLEIPAFPGTTVERGVYEPLTDCLRSPD